MVYVSERIRLAPYEFLHPSFKRYIVGNDENPDVPEFQGITIYARFVPSEKSMLGHMLREGKRN